VTLTSPGRASKDDTVLYDEYSVFSKHMVLYIPRTSDLKQIAKLVPAGGKATGKGTLLMVKIHE
jgi:hypothetical protein